MAGRQPEFRVDRPVSTQSWRRLAFLHWRVRAQDVNTLLPDGLAADLFDGSAWVSLTPFEMRSARLVPFPAVPGVSDFPETNVRTYVRTPDGHDGLFFLSLDCTRLVTVLSLRALDLPYQWSRMTVRHTGDVVRYRCERRSGEPPPRSAVEVRVGETLPEADRTELDDWLSGRWRAFTRGAGRRLEVRISHQPWPLRRAELLHLDDELLPAAGFRDGGRPELVRFSPGVDARIARPRILPGGR